MELKVTLNAGSKVKLLVAATTLGLAGLALIDQQALAGTHLAPCELQPPMQPGTSMPQDSEATQTRITTVGQAYHCILDNYFNGPNLSSRALLVPAFARVTQELQRRGLDQSRAQLPALTGNRFRDWDAFSGTYSAVTANLSAAIQQALAQAILQAMIDSLRDNHAAWQKPQQPLNLPLVVLVGRTCISACDVFANAIKDARIGHLVGTRTGGMVSGPTYGYVLNDGSTLLLPKYYQLGARRQNIDTIGVAPHVYAPLTALDLSAGRDPALTKALELLQ